jgi:hypothetical protein
MHCQITIPMDKLSDWYRAKEKHPVPRPREAPGVEVTLSATAHRAGGLSWGRVPKQQEVAQDPTRPLPHRDSGPQRLKGVRDPTEREGPQDRLR